MYKYRNFIIISLLSCVLALQPQRAHAQPHANGVLVIDMPATVNTQDSYVLELRYTYKTPLEAIPTLRFAQYSATQLHMLPNLFSLDVKTTRREYSYTVLMQKGTHSLYLYPHMLEGDVVSLTLEVPQALLDIFGSIQNTIEVQIYARGVETMRKLWSHALPLSVEDMLFWKSSLHTDIGNGDGDVFRWSAYPSAVVLVFKSNAVQAQYLKRLAFFVEKKGTRGSLLTQAALQARKGWGAHDYKADDLARFFEAARLQNVTLTLKEYALKKLLLDLGILQYKEPRSAETDIARSAVTHAVGTISTISRSYSQALQKTLLTHELLHAWFFTDARLRDVVNEQWVQSSPALKKAWKAFLARKGYDSNFEYLVQNEFFAYLLQNSKDSLARSVNSWFAYAKVETRRAFLQEMTSVAEKLEAYVRQVYNAQAGFLQYRF